MARWFIRALFAIVRAVLLLGGFPVTWRIEHLTTASTSPRGTRMGLPLGLGRSRGLPFLAPPTSLTGTDPITPANPVSLLKGSGTDGFMCLAAAAPAMLAASGASGASGASAAAGLAETGPAADALPIVGGGVAALLLGVALMIFAGRRRRHA